MGWKLCLALSLAIFGLFALLSGIISFNIKGNSQIGHFLKWLKIVVFVGIGSFILLSNK
jgi:uncharacterized membrane-anchored protein